jgi:hypothetical protein
VAFLDFIPQSALPQRKCGPITRYFAQNAECPTSRLATNLDLTGFKFADSELRRLLSIVCSQLAESLARRCRVRLACPPTTLFCATALEDEQKKPQARAGYFREINDQSMLAHVTWLENRRDYHGPNRVVC